MSQNLRDQITIPQTIRAWTYTQSGLPSKTVRLTNDFEAPSISNLDPEDVLVEVSYVAMNAGFTTMMQALPPQPYSLPHIYNRKNRCGIPEFEFSGRILATGSDVLATRPDLQSGTLVLGCCAAKKVFVEGKGALAQYTVAPATQLIPLSSRDVTEEGGKPPMSLKEASGLSACGSTAIQVLDLSGLKAGDKIFINGGSTSVGMLVIQVARYVVGTTGTIVSACSAANTELVKSVGADEIIDYIKHDPLHEYLLHHHSEQPFDAIIDCVGIRELYVNCAPYLAPGKTFINLGAMTAMPTFLGLLSFVWNQHMLPLWPVILGGVPRSYRFYSARPNLESMARIMRLAEKGLVKVAVDSVWEMEDVQKAYERVESKRARGKVVIHVQD